MHTDVYEIWEFRSKHLMQSPNLSSHIQKPQTENSLLTHQD